MFEFFISAMFCRIHCGSACVGAHNGGGDWNYSLCLPQTQKEQGERSVTVSFVHPSPTLFNTSYFRTHVSLSHSIAPWPWCHISRRVHPTKKR